MTNAVSRRLQADWPTHMSYDKADPAVANFYSIIKGTLTENSSIFYNKRQIDIFLLSMALGIEARERKKVSIPSQTIRRDALTEDEVWMMCGVALAEEGTLDVLADPSRVVRICEEYSNGGIGILMSLNTRSGSMSEPYEESLEGLLDRMPPGSR